MATQNADFPAGEPTQAAVSTAAALVASTVLAPKDSFHIPLLSSHATPAFFQHIKLRRGKWTREEEKYAEFLIQQFEQGSLEGCENGCTLRAFLSRKLHCAPMRISKKFAGKSIGKLVFLRKTDGMKCNSRQRDLEVIFHKSLCEEMKETGHPFVGQYLPLPMTVLPPGLDRTKQLHPTYLNALSQLKASPNVNSGTRTVQGQAAIITYRPVAPGAAAPSQMTIAPLPPAPLRHSVHHPSATVQATATNYPTTTGQVTQQPVPTSQRAHHPAPSNLRGHPALPFVGARHLPAPKRVDEPDSNVPDFLLGFERVPDHAHIVPGTPFFGDFDDLLLQCSPPLTSKSFDELHRLLGSDLPLNLSPFDLSKNLKRDTGLNPDESNAARDSETNAAFGVQVSADLYATFAQQSAHAVSQHSAYCRIDSPCEIEGKHVWAEQSPALAELSSSLATAADKNAQAISRANILTRAQQEISIPPKPPQTFSVRSNIVSGSEWSTEDGSSSMLGSIRSSSENTSSDSDSISDQGPPRKKTKATIDREVVTSGASHRCSLQTQ